MSPVSFLRKALALSAGLMVISASAQTSLVNYAFTGNTANATSVASSLTVSAFSTSDGISISNTSPVSSGYTGSSGSYYSSDNNWGSAGNYFQFTLTPNASTSLTLASLSFGYRMSSTSAPTGFTLTSSSDNYATTIASSSLSNADTAWHSTGTISITLSSFTSSTVFRLTPTGALNNTATMRIDDFVISGTASAVPEPSTYAAVAGVLALGGVMWQRRRSRVLVAKA